MNAAQYAGTMTLMATPNGCGKGRNAAPRAGKA